MSIDIDAKKPVLGMKIGGLSGRAIKTRALRCVYEIYDEIKIPIIGCGGITNWRDVMEYVLAGAKAVQIGSSILHEDIDVFKKIQKGMKEYMITQNLETIEDLVGSGHA